MSLLFPHLTLSIQSLNDRIIALFEQMHFVYVVLLSNFTFYLSDSLLVYELFKGGVIPLTLCSITFVTHQQKEKKYS